MGLCLLDGDHRSLVLAAVVPSRGSLAEPSRSLRLPRAEWTSLRIHNPSFSTSGQMATDGFWKSVMENALGIAIGSVLATVLGALAIVSISSIAGINLSVETLYIAP